MQQMHLVRATVKYPAQSTPRQTQYGPRINVVLTLPDGTEYKHWANPDDPVKWLKKGEEVQLFNDGRSYKLVAPLPQNGQQGATPAAIAVATPAYPPAREPRSVDVAEYVAIFNEIKTAMPDCSEQTWRAAASTLFMQRCKLSQEF